MKKLIIFDAYGTLISTGTGSLDSTKKILALQDKDIDPVSFYAEWKKLHKEQIFNCIKTSIFLTEWDIFSLDLKIMYERYNINRPYKEDVKLMLESQFNRRLFDDVKEVIDELKKKYRVVIGSTADTYPLIKNLEDNNLIVDEVYTSEMMKKYKPDLDFYRYILEKEKCAPENSIFIGDTLLDDIKGPKTLGMTTILIDRKENIVINDVKPDYIINNFNELLTIL